MEVFFGQFSIIIDFVVIASFKFSHVKDPNEWISFWNDLKFSKFALLIQEEHVNFFQNAL